MGSFKGRRDQVLSVPLQALVMKEIKPKAGVTLKPGASRDEEGVFVLQDGKATFYPVTTGLMGELNVEVLTGLKGGEALITGPFKTLRELKGGEAVHLEKKKKKQDDKKAN